MGWLWLFILAIKESDILWIVLGVLIAPSLIVRGFLRFDEMKVPTLMYLIGLIGYAGGGFIA